MCVCICVEKESETQREPFPVVLLSRQRDLAENQGAEHYVRAATVDVKV